MHPWRWQNLGERWFFVRWSGNGKRDRHVSDRQHPASAGVWNHMEWRVWVKWLGDDVFFASSSFWQRLAFLDLWWRCHIFKASVFKSLSVPSSHCLLLCVSVKSSLLPLIRTHVAAFRVHGIIRDTLPISTSFHFIPSAKALFPNELTLTDSKD